MAKDSLSNEPWRNNDWAIAPKGMYLRITYESLTNHLRITYESLMNHLRITYESLTITSYSPARQRLYVKNS